MTVRDGLCLATGTLTALPVPPPRRVDGGVPAVAMVAAPLVGVLPAGAAGLACLLGDVAGLGPAPLAVLGPAVIALSTRGLHLDGLADTADGLAASYDRERALAVMRTGDVGPAGAVCLVLVLLGQVACLAQLFARGPAGGAVGLLVAAVAGRLGLTVLCVRGVPAARAGGLGAAVAGTVPRTAAAGVVALAAVGAWVLAGAAGTVAVAAAVATAAVLGRRCTRRLGGITGDVLGATVELGTLAGLTVLAAASGASGL